MFLTPFRRSSRAGGKLPRNRRASPPAGRTLGAANPALRLPGLRPASRAPGLSWKGGQRVRQFDGDQRRHDGCRVADGHGRRQRQPGGGLRVHGHRHRLGPDCRGITAYNGAAGDEFGTSVSISGGPDGGRSPLPRGRRQRRPGGGLRVSQSPASAGHGPPRNHRVRRAAGDNFGASVAVSGNTVVVGAPLHTVGANAGQGAAYVFTKSGYSWPQFAEIDASNGGASDFSALGLDQRQHGGGRGAPGATVGGNAGQGAAYVFTEPSLAGPT